VNHHQGRCVTPADGCLIVPRISRAVSSASDCLVPSPTRVVIWLEVRVGLVWCLWRHYTVGFGAAPDVGLGCVSTWYLARAPSGSSRDP